MTAAPGGDADPPLERSLRGMMSDKTECAGHSVTPPPLNLLTVNAVRESGESPLRLSTNEHVHQRFYVENLLMRSQKVARQGRRRRPVTRCPGPRHGASCLVGWNR